MLSRKGLRPTRSGRARLFTRVGASGAGADGVGCGRVKGFAPRDFGEGRREGGEFETESSGDGSAVAVWSEEKPWGIPPAPNESGGEGQGSGRRKAGRGLS